MKAVYFESTGSVANIRFGNLPQPVAKPAEGEVRVKFLAGSLNHLDLWVIRGLPHISYRFPHVAGADAVVEVLESRSNVWSRGDRALVYPAMSDEAWQTAHSENQCRDFKIRGETNSGVFIEEFVISERYLAQAPEHLNLSQLACVPLAYLTAWQMITEKAEIFPGRFDCRQLGSILVHGAGSGVTQALLEILLSMKIPPNQIFVSSRDLLKLDGWKARGLKTVLANDSFEQALKSAAPKKFSFIFDHVGSKFFELNVKCLVDGGRLISCGATSGFQAQLDLRHLFFRQLQLIGSTMGSLRHFQEVVRWISQRKIVPGVSQEWHWSEAAAAYLHLESGTQNGKIILRAM